MKILYIGTNVATPQYPLVDYQNDCLLIGLKELFGDDVVDVQRRDHLYADFSPELAAQQYGRGFTVTRVIDQDNADRTDIEEKIKNKYFDLVVYGSIWRNHDYMDLVTKHYPKNKIALVDGDDHTKFNYHVKKGALYFKRELQYEANMEHEQYFDRVLPIGFAFPTKKLSFNNKKSSFMAHSNPKDRRTYIFNDEASYYGDYQKAQYAITMKKAGWDALRHYEIMGNGCIPLFDQLEASPRFIMTKFPKALLSKISFFHKNDFKYLEKNYDYFLNEVTEHFMRYNTTHAMVKYLLKDLSRYRVYKGQQ